MAITVKIIPQEEKLSLVDALAELKVSFFSEYPYLQTLDVERERKHFTKVLSNPASVIIVAFDDDKVIGSIPSMDFVEYYKDQKSPYDLWFRKTGNDKSKYVYSLYTLTRPEYRSMGLNPMMIEVVDKEVKRLGYVGRLNMTIARPVSDPKAPEGFRQPGGFYKKFGYELLPIRPIVARWVDNGDEKITDKLFELRLKSLE